HLLEAEELDDAEVHRTVEPQAPLVRPERAVEADPKAAIDVDLAAVVLPRHAEDDLPLGLADPLDDLVLGVVGVFAQYRREGLGHLGDGLVKLAFSRIAPDHILDDV